MKRKQILIQFVFISSAGLFLDGMGSKWKQMWPGELCGSWLTFASDKQQAEPALALCRRKERSMMTIIKRFQLPALLFVIKVAALFLDKLYGKNTSEIIQLYCGGYTSKTLQSSTQTERSEPPKWSCCVSWRKKSAWANAKLEFHTRQFKASDRQNHLHEWISPKTINAAAMVTAQTWTSEQSNYSDFTSMVNWKNEEYIAVWRIC